MSQPSKSSVHEDAPNPGGKPPVWYRDKVFLAVALCLCLGGAVVWWRAVQRGIMERARAQVWVQGRAASLEAGLSRTFSSAEVLAMLVRQGGGRLTGAQKTGTEILAVFPGIAALELQPGGVTSEVIPRAGHEKAIGTSIMRNPAAITAIQSRKLVADGPIMSIHGQLQVVGRLPVYLRDARGKEAFWGLVSVAASLTDIVSQAKLETLATQGYDYSFYALPLPLLKPVFIAGHGKSPVEDVVQQSFTLANLEFRLAVWPSGGWVRRAPILLESMVALVLAGLLGLGFHIRKSMDLQEASLAEYARLLAQEKSRLIQMENQAHFAKSSSAAELRAAKEAVETLRAQLREAESQARQSQDRGGQLEAETLLAIESRTKELNASRELTSSLQARLSDAEAELRLGREQFNRAQEEWRRTLAIAEEGLQAKGTQLAKLEEDSAVLHARMRETEAELHFNREQFSRAQEAWRLTLASAETARQELADRLVELETQKAAAVVETPGLMTPATMAEIVPGEQTVPTPAEIDGSVEPVPLEIAPESAPLLTAENDFASESNPEDASESVTELAPDAASEPEDVPDTELPSALESGPTPAQNLEPDAESKPNESEPPASMESEAVVEPAIESASEPGVDTETVTPARPKPEKSSRRKKNKDNGQLSLFGGETMAEPSPEPVVEPDEEDQPPARPETKSAHASTTEKSKAAHGPALNPGLFKKTAKVLYMLLAESDPGAKDCLADNRRELRAAFSPEAFAEFESKVRGSAFHEALEILNKTARRHGLKL